MRKIEKFATINYDKRMQKSQEKFGERLVNSADKIGPNSTFRFKGKMTKDPNYIAEINRRKGNENFTIDELKELGF